MTQSSRPTLKIVSESASECLKRNKDLVLRLWEERVRQEISLARNEPHPILIDTLPSLIDQLCDALSPNNSRRLATEGSTACQEHGSERARMTRYNVESVVQEYQILREVIYELLSSKGSLNKQEENTLRLSIDDIIKQAAMAFSLVQNTIREQFFMTLTHDLRGPLSVARTSAQMILRYPDHSEKHIRYAEKIVESISRVDRMITDLLDANRVRGGGRLSLDITHCNLQRISQMVAEEISVAYQGKIEVVADPVFGFWDENGIRRIIENLCINAIKYGDKDIPVTLCVSQSHGRTLISVHNYGSYIPIEEQGTLFDAYRRAKSTEAGRSKGWGLGLALVRGMAEAHGGSVFVDSSPERGTTFTVDIPTDSRPFHEVAKQPFSKC